MFSCHFTFLVQRTIPELLKSELLKLICISGEQAQNHAEKRSILCFKNSLTIMLVCSTSYILYYNSMNKASEYNSLINNSEIELKL